METPMKNTSVETENQRSRKSKTVGKLVGWRPCGPVRAMLNNELRGNPDITAVVEAAIVAGLSSKYPKLASRFNILREEALG